MVANTVTEVYRSPIDHPAAWTAASVGDKAGITRRLSQPELAAIDALLAATRHIPMESVTRRDFDHPAVNALMAEVDRIILDGRGAVILAGLSGERYALDELERIYWGLGLHLGTPAVQSVRGERLGHVRHVPKVGGGFRGYLSMDELRFHADSFETVGLMCAARAETGGFSRLVSALSLHNAILAERPDLLVPLYQGHYLGAPEVFPYSRIVTRYRFPVFCNVDGVISCAYNRYLIEQGARLSEQPLPPALVEAIEFLEKTAQRADLRLEFMLEQGEILFFNNFVMLHARTAFENSEAHRRHYLRLWLDVPDGRPVIRSYIEQGRTYERQYHARLASEADEAKVPA